MSKHRNRPIVKGVNPARTEAMQKFAEKQAIEKAEKENEARRDGAEREIKCRAIIDETLSKHRCKFMTQAFMTTNQLQVQLLIIAKRPVGRVTTALLPFVARAEGKRVERCQLAISEALKSHNCHLQAGLIVNDSQTVTDIRIFARPNPEPEKEKKAEPKKDASDEIKPEKE